MKLSNFTIFVVKPEYNYSGFIFKGGGNLSNQYFENNENLKKDEHELLYYFKGRKLRFWADNGVFSKKSIDFGTSLLLREIKINENTKKVLDVGCGYGPIGITIASEFESLMVDMIDVNTRALNLARKNANLNNVSNVNIFESNIYENVKESYNLIVTNPPIRAGKVVVHRIILDAYEHLKTGGSLWCVIQKKQGAESAIKVLTQKYQDVVVHCKDKLYYIIEAIKKSN